MAIGPRLDLRQSQTLSLTPQLQQAFRLLALSNLELAAEIGAELDANPLLREAGDSTDEASAIDAAPEPGGRDAAGQEDAPAATDDWLAGGTLPADDPLDQWQDEGRGDHGEPDAGQTRNTRTEGDGAGGDERGGERGGEALGVGGEFDWEQVAAPAASLADHLTAQAGERLSGQDLGLVMALIEEVEPTGYFTGHMGEIAARLGVSRPRLEAALTILQGFDPAGVGARSLAECLALQAIEADRYDPCMRTLIAHLDWLATGRIEALQKRCGVDDADMADMIAEVRSYNPKPGLKFGGETPGPVVPDLIVRRRGGDWEVEVNPATLPRLIVDRRYHVTLAQSSDRATRAWLDQCLTSGRALIRMLDQRQRTILKVVAAMVEHQAGFFDHGVARLRPLTHRALAERVDLHESSVSRVTSNKYLSCPRGLFPLKFFFPSASTAETDDGGEVASAEAVKQAIATLIGQETAKAILSDDMLVTRLTDQGFTVARRTVAKYRESLGLGSSVERRRAKALADKITAGG